MTDIVLVLGIPDEDANPNDSTGLTERAFEELNRAIMRLGYEFVKGPEIA